jgi:hypothetical protein
MKTLTVVLPIVFLTGCATMSNWGGLNPDWEQRVILEYGNARATLIHWEKINRNTGIAFICDGSILVTELWGDSSGGTSDNKIARVVLPESLVMCEPLDD